MDNIKNVIFQAYTYYRISNDDGDLAVQGKVESNSITNQRRLITDFLADKPEIILLGEKIDDGYSGVNFDRPAFQQMIEEVKCGNANCIIVKDLSRFGRNYIEVGRFIQKIFPYFGVRFISINDNYDSLTANSTESHIMLPFKNLLNDSYSRDLSVKVRSHLQIKMKNGEFVGSFAVYGYRKDLKNKNKLMIDDYAAMVVRDIFLWRLHGQSDERIAERLNKTGVSSPAEYKKSLGMRYNTGFKTNEKALWSATAVRRILTNETYLGSVIQGKKTTPNHKIKKIIEKKPDDWIIVESAHEPIISANIFNLTKKVMGMDTRISPENNEVYLFSGMVFCGDCKGSMIRRLVGKKYAYQICATNKKDVGCCSSHRISEVKLKEAVLAALKAHICNVVEIKELLEELNNRSAFNIYAKRLEIQLKEVQDNLIKCQNLKIGLYEDLSDGIITKDEFIELKQYYNEQIISCENQIEELKKEQNNKIDSNTGKEWIEFFIQYENISDLDRMILILLIDKIEVFEGNRVKIMPNFQYDYETTLKAITMFMESGGCLNENK